jgi:hypothetical protein
MDLGGIDDRFSVVTNGPVYGDVVMGEMMPVLGQGVHGKKSLHSLLNFAVNLKLL